MCAHERPGAVVSGRCVCRWAGVLVAPLVFWAPCGVLAGWAALCARGRRPAREPSALRASLGVSTRCPARPRHRPPAPQPGPPVPPAPSTPVGPGVLACGSVRRLEARPGPAAAHRHRGRALRSLRRPPHRRPQLGASSRSPARPRHRPPAPRQVPPAPSTPVGPGVLACGSVRRLVVRPGPATRGHRGQATPRALAVAPKELHERKIAPA